MSVLHKEQQRTRVMINTFLIGAVIGVILFDLPNPEDWHWKGIAFTFLLNGSLTLSLSYANGYLAESIHISWTEQPFKRFLVTLVLTVVVTLFIAELIIIFYSYFFWGTSPLYFITNPDIGYFITVLIITFIIALFLHGRRFLFEWKESLLEAERLKRAHLSSRFESLKNQVNPHFLFNSLNVLSTLVYKDPDLAAKFIKKLSDVYRYVLDTREREVVPLSTELEALNAYIFLLQIRFGDNLSVVINLPDFVENTVIPPLTLQMLVENAVKHNIVSRSQPLYIQIMKNRNDYIVVKNNLQIKNNKQESNGIGLDNIKERYRYISERTIQIMQDENSFSVSVPLIEINS